MTAPAKPSAIHKIGDIQYVHMLLTAESGWGKTVFGAGMGRTLLILTDPEGSYSAKKFGSEAEEWTATTADDLDAAYKWLASGGHEHYDLVFVDNISHAQKLFLRRAKDQSLKRPGSKSDPLVPEQGDYLRAQLGIEDYVHKMHSLPVHILWSAWQEEHEDANGDVYFAPAIQGSKGAVAQQIMGYMNINAFGQVIEGDDGKDVRRLWFCHYDKFRGKDRFVALGRYKDNLTMPQMMELITAAKSAPARKTTGATKSAKSAATKRTAVRRRATTK